MKELRKRVILLRNSLKVNIVLADDRKIPIHKDWGNTILSIDEINAIATKPNFKTFGLITGPISDNLEVIDVDLKVFKTDKEKKDFTKELFSFLEDNIENFYKKVSIYQTKSAGFHILFKASNVEGNQKLAKPAYGKEAVIETRGGTMKDGKFRSGYVVFYPDFHYKGLEYEGIKYISDSDRECLIQCCKALSSEPVKAPIKADKPHRTETTGETTWNDYNARTDAWDLIAGEFEVIRNLSDKIIVRRNGAASPHSGYIYKDSNCLYLFSTGTNYPAETLLTPFAIYAHKHHNGDFTAAAGELYRKGFGERITAPKIEIKEDKPPIVTNNFPLDIFPEEIRHNFEENRRVLGLNPDFMACGLLWSASVMMGNNYRLQIKKGWEVNASVWLACVARAGVGKTPALETSLKTLERINTKEVKHYQKEFEKWVAYQGKSKEEKQLCNEVEKPINRQFIAKDSTLEALIELHSFNPNGVGVYFDELTGWFKDMNKYREGSDEQFWLSSWSGTAHITNRKSTGATLVDNPHLPVIGGIQPGVLTEIATSARKNSGFMDRVLFAYPDAEPQPMNENELDSSVAEWMENYIQKNYSKAKKFTHYDENGEVKPSICRLTPAAFKEFRRVHDWLIELQNCEYQNEFIKSIYPKMITYLGRFALICHYLDSTINTEKDHQTVDVVSIISAEKLVKYFINNALKIKDDSTKLSDVKTVLGQNKTILRKADRVIKILESGADYTQKDIAEEVGCSKGFVSKIVKKFKDDSIKTIPA